MSSSETQAAPSLRPGRFSVLSLAGPGLIVAAAGIGSGDVVASTVGGARYGVTLLWCIVIGAFFKFVLSEGIARWQLATGSTFLEGCADHLPGWAKVYFGGYLLVWTVAVSAALTNATGLGIANLTGGAISQPWGAVLHSFIGFLFVLLGGYAHFEKAMKALVALMGFSILGCAIMTLREPELVVRGLLVPAIPAGSSTYVLSLIGGIGGSITILSYNYWMQEEGIRGAHMLKYVRADLGVAYVFTALFGIAIMLTADQAFFRAGITITDAQAVRRMAETLSGMLGPVGFYAYSAGFWAAVFASLLGVWQSVPYLYADLFGIHRGVPQSERSALTKVTSRPYRIALAFITLAPLPFAFIGRPLFVIVTYTIVGSLFIPFLAATLLYLNNRVPWTSGTPRNSLITNVVLVAVLALFVAVGMIEISAMLARG